jgi:hypothetical protein
MVINCGKGQQQPQSLSILIHCTTITQKAKKSEATAVIQTRIWLFDTLKKPKYDED